MYEYDLSRPMTFEEGQAMDRAALAAGPVARYHDGSPVFVRYDDVVHLLTSPDADLGYGEQMEQMGITQGLVHELIAGSFIVADLATHTRIRSLVSRAFAVRPMERMRAVARRAAEQALDALPATGEFDLFRDFADAIPLRVMCALLGIPENYAAELRAFLRDVSPVILAPSVAPEQLERAERALERLYAYAEQVAAEKLADPGDDVISLLAVAERDGRMSRAELRSMITLLLVAGTDTTRSLIGMSLHVLAEHPGELARLRADPDLVVPAVEEILRYTSPGAWVVRFAQTKLERAGLTLEPGACFYLSIAAANLDPRAFAEPDRFDLGRKDCAHITFGRGRHFCLGAALARVEGQEVLRALAARGVGLELLGKAPLWVRAGAMTEPATPVQMRTVR